MKNFYLAFLVMTTSVIYAQNFTFLNTNQSLIDLNPSYAGSNGLVRNQFSYRTTDPQLSFRFLNYSNALDFYLKPARAGIAINWEKESIPVFGSNNQQLGFTYAQHLTLLENDLKIIPSLQINYLQRVRDPRNNFFVNTFSSNLAPLQQNFFSLASGLLINYKNNIYAGLYFLGEDRIKDELFDSPKFPRHLKFHSSYNHAFGEKTLLQFKVILESDHASSYSQFNLNLLLFKYLLTGVGCKEFQNPMANIGFRNDVLTVLIGYDQYFSKLGDISTGSWEMHCAINIKNKEQRGKVTSFESW